MIRCFQVKQQTKTPRRPSGGFLFRFLWWLNPYGEYYTVHYLKPEADEKGNTIYRIIPIEQSVICALKQVHLVCIRENVEYVSPDSFKYCSRVIHNELQMAFDYHSLRHTHATTLIENGADVKDVQTRLGHNNINTALQVYIHDTDVMSKRSVELFEKAAAICQPLKKGLTNG